jgi:hypothetical protein
MSKALSFLLTAWLGPMLISGMVTDSSGQARAEDKNARSAASQDNDVLTERTYTLLGLGNGPAGDGTELSVRVYASSEGANVTTVHGHFKSKAAAKAELERRLKQAAKVLEHASRVDSSGKAVGERAIARFAATKSIPDHFAVLLTDGYDFFAISSDSMELAVDMAKRYYKYY